VNALAGAHNNVKSDTDVVRLTASPAVSGSLVRSRVGRTLTPGNSLGDRECGPDDRSQFGLILDCRTRPQPCSATLPSPGGRRNPMSS